MSPTSSVNSSYSLSVACWGMTEQFSGLSSTARVSCCVIITTCGRVALKCLLHPPQLRGERVSCSLLAQHNAELTVTHTHLYSCHCEDQLWHDTVPHLGPKPLNKISMKLISDSVSAECFGRAVNVEIIICSSVLLFIIIDNKPIYNKSVAVRAPQCWSVLPEVMPSKTQFS